MFSERLGKLVTRHWVVVLLGWLALVVVVHHFAPRWDDVTRDGDFAYLPDRMTSVRGSKLLAVAFPDYFSKSQVALVLARESGRITADDVAVADRLLAAFPASDDEWASASDGAGGAAPLDPANPIAAVWSFRTPVIGDKLMSPPSEQGQAALIVLHLRSEFMAIGNMPLLRRIYRTLEEIERQPDFPPGLRLGVTGSAAIGADMLFSAEQSIRNTELTTIVMVVLILVLVYRAPGLVLVTLVTIGASVWLATDLVALAARASDSLSWLDFKIFKTTRIFIVAILYGSGTDFCLFLISRYKEELQRGLDCPQAAARSLGQVGSALAASALTTVVGLAMMGFADFGKFRNSGPAIGVCLLVTLVACVTLAPALLRGTGRLLFWPFGAPGTSGDGGRASRLGPGARWTSSLWERLSRAIVARPGLILVGCLAVLLPLTRPARVIVANLASGDPAHARWEFDAPVTYDLLAELRPDRPSVQGARLLWRFFPADQTSPLTVLISQPGTNFGSREGRRKIAALTRELFHFEYVDASGNTVRPIVGVRSLTEPMGDVPGSFNPLSQAGRRKLITMRHPRTLARFLSQTPPMAGQVTRLDLISCYTPFSRESVDLVDRIEKALLAKTVDAASPWHGAEIDFIGTSAGIRDLEAVTASDRVRIQWLVTIAVLGVLVVILRRPAICVYLVLSVLLGYYVTIGATELLFSWIYGAAYTGMDWKVPVFLFVILIAVGEDYNVYLATRVFEEQGRLGPLEGLRVAVVRTGGIITSCGIIMAATFASMASGTLRAMQELGFALSLGVLLDTFVIRTILVPAFLALLARRQERKLAEGSLGARE